MCSFNDNLLNFKKQTLPVSFVPNKTCHGHSPKSAEIPPTIRLTRFFHKYLSVLPCLSGFWYDFTSSQGLVPHDKEFDDIVGVVIAVVVVAVVVDVVDVVVDVVDIVDDIVVGVVFGVVLSVVAVIVDVVDAWFTISIIENSYFKLLFNPLILLYVRRPTWPSTKAIGKLVFLPDMIKNMIDPNKALRSMTIQVRNPISVLVKRLLGFFETNSSL